MLRALDHGLARALNGAARANPTLGTMVALAARWLAGAEILLGVALGLSGRPFAAMRALLAVGLIYALVEVIGARLARRRPFARHAEVEVMLAHAPQRSFPSRHVASAVAMAVVAAAARPRIGRLMALLAWPLALARVGAGLHYPSDVLGGALLGAAVGRLLRPPC